ncbi:MAG: FIST C-terminal domain-containing protein [Planctomycetes bacterium]|nr:FIST C-terminal domain-containing protein [Planctomycetota bacterium]
MRVAQHRWTSEGDWKVRSNGSVPKEPQLVLVFGAQQLLSDATVFRRLRERFPIGTLVCCSTAGEISQEEVTDDSLVATELELERSSLRVVARELRDPAESAAVGSEVAAALSAPSLRHVVVLCEGLSINGSALAEGMRKRLPETVAVTGGLAGDGARMATTCVGCDAPPKPGQVVAIGFYGDALHVGFCSLGGWDPFGPEREITRSKGNVLYELDGKSALQLYREYLGEHAEQLPSSGLLFPLAVRAPDSATSLVRTLLAVDDEHESITYAGDIPQHSRARLMRANFDRLIEGAVGAAREAARPTDPDVTTLALLVSCVGRKLLLGQRIEEEVEGVREVLGPGPVLAGFYSYGEICPQMGAVRCELHNQTMTITTLWEETV